MSLRCKLLSRLFYGHFGIFSTSLIIKKHNHLQLWHWYLQVTSLPFWAWLALPSWFAQLISTIPSFRERQREGGRDESDSFLEVGLGPVCEFQKHSCWHLSKRWVVMTHAVRSSSANRWDLIVAHISMSPCIPFAPISWWRSSVIKKSIHRDAGPLENYSRPLTWLMGN